MIFPSQKLIEEQRTDTANVSVMDRMEGYFLKTTENLLHECHVKEENNSEIIKYIKH